MHPLLLVAAVLAVYVGWPMDEQLPNVARVQEPYSFTLAEGTYRSSSGGTIAYLARGMPSWMAFDGALRTFSGVPAASDVLEFTISLVGNDTDGSSLSVDYQMLVLNSTGVEVRKGLFPQLAAAGATNGVDGLVVRQGARFNVTFSKDDFGEKVGSSRPVIAYYGRLGDRTPLPNWVSFDPDSLRFAGTAPYVALLIAPAVEFKFGFIASDYYGFAAAESQFSIVVGAHYLAVSGVVEVEGDNFKVPLSEHVELDGAPIARGNVSLIVAELPQGVTFDQDSWTLKGLSLGNGTLTVADVYGNSVKLPLDFDDLPNLNATRGEYFSHQLKVAGLVSSNGTWLQWHSGNQTLAGMAPEDLTRVRVEVQTGGKRDERGFDIVGVPRTSSTSSSSASSSTTSSSSSTSSSNSSTTRSSSSTTTASTSSSSSSTPSSSSSTTAGASHNHSKRPLILGLAIGLPLFFLLLLLLLLLFLLRRRRSDDSEKRNLELLLHGPGFGTHEARGEADAKLALDVASALLSMTHVESDRTFYDAEEPAQLWRAQTELDVKAQFIRDRKHALDMSMSTVNTDQLFLVRLVEDLPRRSLRHIAEESDGTFYGLFDENFQAVRTPAGSVEWRRSTDDLQAQAKLVEFTRKASLKDSARSAAVHEGETAQLRNSDSTDSASSDSARTDVEGR